MSTDFQVPKITAETIDDTKGSFVIEPLDKGFAYQQRFAFMELRTVEYFRSAICRQIGAHTVSVTFLRCRGASGSAPSDTATRSTIA